MADSANVHTRQWGKMNAVSVPSGLFRVQEVLVSNPITSNWLWIIPIYGLVVFLSLFLTLWKQSVIKKVKIQKQSMHLYAFFWVILLRLNFYADVSEHSVSSVFIWRWNRQVVPKRRHIKFRGRGITQKKAYKVQNTAKVWNQEKLHVCTYFVMPTPKYIHH